MSDLLVNPYRFGAPIFNPLSLPWSSVYWVDDPAQVAAWPADGTRLRSPQKWKDSGSAAVDLFAVGIGAVGSGNGCIFRSAAGGNGINGKAAVEFDGTGWWTVGIVSIAQPYTLVCIGTFGNNGATQDVMPIGATTGTRGFGLNLTPNYIESFGSGTGLGGTPDGAQHIAYAFGNGAASTLKLDGATIIPAASHGTTALATARRIGQLSSNDTASSAVEPYVGKGMFFGYLARALTGTEEANLLGFSQQYYGTP